MTENFAERFVDHRNIGLAAQRVSELPLNHAERGFYIGTLVIVGQKFFASELEVVIHPAPRSTAIARRARCERDERHPPGNLDHRSILLAGVCLVCRNLANREVRTSRLQQWSKLFAVGCRPFVNLYRRYDVRLDSAHEVTFNPIVLLDFFAVLVIEPANEARRGKARRIYSEVSFDRLERQAALGDERAEQRCQCRILKIVENAVVVRQTRDEPAFVRRFQVSHKPTSGNGALTLNVALKTTSDSGNVGLPHFAACRLRMP